MSRKICSLGIRTLKPEYVRLTINERLYPLDHLGKQFKKSIYSFSMVMDSFQGFLFSVSV